MFLELAQVILVTLKLSEAANLQKEMVVSHAPIEIQQEFERLKLAAGPDAANATLYIATKDKGINAYADAQDHIVVLQGLVDFTKADRGELIGVLAHELGHVVHGDLQQRIIICGITDYARSQCERQADDYAPQLLEKAGFDKCNLNKAMKHFHKKFGDEPEGADHPPIQDRVKYTSEGCEK